MSTPIQNFSHLPQLVGAFRSGDLVIFAGAGVSMAGGLPSWGRLIDHVIDYAYHDSPSADERRQIEQAASYRKQNRLIDALTMLKSRMPRASYGAAIEQVLNDRPNNQPLDVPEVALAIAALAPELRAVVTTNLDRFLERAFHGDWPAMTLPTLDRGQKKHFILKIHGTLGDRKTWVFTKDEYRRLVHATPGLQRFMHSLYTTRTLLFVGYGLRDPDLDFLLDQILVSADGQPPEHYALVARCKPEDDDPVRRRDLRNAGIKLIEYDNDDGTHAEVIHVLHALAGQRGSPPTTSSSGSRQADSTSTVDVAAERIARLTTPVSRLKLLFLAANPPGTTPTRFDEEAREVEAELDRHPGQDNYTMDKALAVRQDELMRELISREPNLLHFAMHGEGSSLVIEPANPRRVQQNTKLRDDLLARLIANHEHSIRCVVLNACHTKEIARQLVKYVPCAIGMNGAIANAAAIEFAQTFYMMVARGRSVSEAYEFARVAAEQATPGSDSITTIHWAENVDKRTFRVLRRDRR